MTDHKIFKTSCKTKIATAFSSCQVPDHNFSEKRFQALRCGVAAGSEICQFFDQTRYKEIPIKKNKTIQTKAIK